MKLFSRWGLGVAVCLFGLLDPNLAFGQLGPQHNYYLEGTIDADGADAAHALKNPRAVAFGPSQNPLESGAYVVYVVEHFLKEVKVFTQGGDYLFKFGSEAFPPEFPLGAIKGMDVDNAGVLYLGDNQNDQLHRLQVDHSTGVVTHLGTIDLNRGDPGINANPMDVAVTPDEDDLFSLDGDPSTDGPKVMVLDYSSKAVEVFHVQTGTHLRTIGTSGTQIFELGWPVSLDVSKEGEIYVADLVAQQWGAVGKIKVFDADGEYDRSWTVFLEKLGAGQSWIWGPTTVRIGPDGLIHVTRAQWLSCYEPHSSTGSTSEVRHYIYSKDGNHHTSFRLYTIGRPVGQDDCKYLRYPTMGVGPDGSIVFSVKNPSGGCRMYRPAFRTQFHETQTWANRAPSVEIIRTTQRANSDVIEIEFQVTDLDDGQVSGESNDLNGPADPNEQVVAAVLAFEDSKIDLEHLRLLTDWASSSQVQLPGSVTTNRRIRVDWNSGTNWSGDLARFKIAMLAKEVSRELLDVHFLTLGIGSGGADVQISRSPLVQNDFLPVWYWLLATEDPGIELRAGGEVYGVGGAYDDLLLASGETTTEDGRAYIIAEKMGMREAAGAELTAARRATNPDQGETTTVNQWSPVRSVGGKPKKVNEWGFDTGDWGAESWWVVKP